MFEKRVNVKRLPFQSPKDILLDRITNHDARSLECPLENHTFPCLQLNGFSNRVQRYLRLCTKCDLTNFTKIRLEARARRDKQS